MIYYVCSIVSIILSGYLLYLYVKFRNQFDSYIGSIDKSQYFLTGLFYIGFGCISLFQINMNSKRANNRRKVIAELKGEEFAQFYYYVNLAGQITYGLIFLILAFLIPAFTKDMTMFLLALLVGIALVLYLDLDIDSKLKKKKEEMMLEFPHILSKMALLVNAGLPVRDTFWKIAENKSGGIYDEIHVMLSELSNGIPERKALNNMAERCGIAEIRKFTSMLSQNLQKGSADTAKGLIEMSNDIWLNRTSNVREIGEKASTKLLIPIVIIFAGIMIMVLAPMVSSMSF